MYLTKFSLSTTVFAMALTLGVASNAFAQSTSPCDNMIGTWSGNLTDNDGGQHKVTVKINTITQYPNQDPDNPSWTLAGSYIFDNSAETSLLTDYSSCTLDSNGAIRVVNFHFGYTQPAGVEGPYPGNIHSEDVSDPKAPTSMNVTANKSGTPEASPPYYSGSLHK